MDAAAETLAAPLRGDEDARSGEPAAEPDVEAQQADASPVSAGSFRRLMRELSARSGPGGGPSESNLSMEWKDICFSIGEKRILKNITGMAEPGHLTAVLGPSGSGKTTLLNVLAGRQRTTGAGGAQPMSGVISVGGRVISVEDFKSNIAYVMQDDRLMATETVRECIEFSAYMRRPGTPQEREDLVKTMLDTLGLNKCANTIAGNALLKGISGGERKRTSVGIELITDPKMLFLDEPLSGLDSYAAYTLVQALKDLALAGVPVLCTVHQPSSEIFAMFDDVVILHDGEAVYHGPVKALAAHFSRWEKCPSNFNPADHVMFLLQREAEESGERIREMKEYWPSCALGKGLAEVVDGLRSRNASTPLGLAEAARSSRLGFCAQLAVLTRREVRATLRNKGVLIARYMMAAFLALLYAWLFAGSADKDELECAGNAATFPSKVTDCQSSFQAHYGTLVSLSIATMMGAAQPVLLQFPSERPVFLREYTARQYGVVPYFVSKTLVEMPVLFMSQVVSYTLSFWIMGLQGNFFLLIAVAWGLAVTTSSLALIIGCGVSAGEKAIQFGPLAMVPQMLFSGLFIPVSKIPESLQWVKWLCPLKYAINMGTLVEFHGVKTAIDHCKGDPLAPDCVNRYPGLLLRQSAIEAQGMEWSDLFNDTIVLACLYVGFRIIACTLLWRKGRYVF